MKNRAESQTGFNIIVASLLRENTQWMNDENFNQEIFLNKHPFDADYKGMASFIGFASDDIYPFISKILSNEGVIRSGERPQLLIWLCQTPEDPRSHNIWAEARDAHFSYLVAGMTDYSGSGGAAYRELTSVFWFLNELYGFVLDIRETSSQIGELALALVNECSMREREEEHAE